MITVNGQKLEIKSWFGMGEFLSFTTTDGVCWVLKYAKQEAPGVFTGLLSKAKVQKLW